MQTSIIQGFSCRVLFLPLRHLVLYASKDGLNWDEGRYLRKKTAGNAAYSNNLLLGGGKRLLIQASHAYEHSKANVLHWWLE